MLARVADSDGNPNSRNVFVPSRFRRVHPLDHGNRDTHAADASLAAHNFGLLRNAIQLFHALLLIKTWRAIAILHRFQPS